ncbi:MAG: 3'(2'),5'-bisphosphate nucleotidase CysQ [Gammaproteobacteria bacterium]|nr:3'(2'),5'-bisphosphate nucleotidase CysQ [Gammaproteobacteria bacterium]
MSESLNLEYLCNQCIEIARQAGARILEIYNSDYAIEEKDDKSPLTDADIAAHRTIIKALAALTPDIPVLSEESIKPSFEARQQWQTYWLVDPLDGTKEFIKRNGEFTVNIALINNHKSIIGIIHVPVLNIDYYGWKDGGSFKIEHGKEPKAIQVRKQAGDKLIVVSSRSHSSEQLQTYMKNLGNAELLNMGSSLKFCLIAEGQADLYPRIGFTSEWDTAAAHCIVEQAGGYMTKLDMSELDYNTKDSLLNPFFLVFGDNSRDWSAYLPSKFNQRQL